MMQVGFEEAMVVMSRANCNSRNYAVFLVVYELEGNIRDESRIRNTARLGEGT